MIDVELCIGEWDVVASFESSYIPLVGEVVCVENVGSFRVIRREWHKRRDYKFGVILYVGKVISE